MDMRDWRDMGWLRAMDGINDDIVGIAARYRPSTDKEDYSHMLATKAKPKNMLDSIAVGMFSQISIPGEWQRTKLANGLDVILQQVEEHRWRLAMARENVYPSDTEVDVCRNAFDVPSAAEEQRSAHQYRHPKTHRVIEYRRVELFWTEA
ncbi:MAG: hypothetical protein IPM06_19915 [Rhizobiales bacterium]|nr:hypothetical protein [Hyphomicrobiales bacterium]